MPVKTGLTTEEYLNKVVLPQHGKTYTVIPHGHAIYETKKALVSAGFTVKNELYKSTLDGQVAQGVYHLNHGKDPDMGLMFAWSNSYNKSMRFKCAVGGHVFACMNGVIKGDMGSFMRKHTGSALYEATAQINEQISKAKDYFDILVEDKELLKDVILSPREKGSILGRLFAEEEILTLTQVGIVKREMDKPSYMYNADPNSAWSMYNHITIALKESHPQTYLQDHEILHDFFINEYGQLTTGQQYSVGPVQQEHEELVEAESVSEHGVLFL